MVQCVRTVLYSPESIEASLQYYDVSKTTFIGPTGNKEAII